MIGQKARHFAQYRIRWIRRIVHQLLGSSHLLCPDLWNLLQRTGQIFRCAENQSFLCRSRVAHLDLRRLCLCRSCWFAVPGYSHSLTFSWSTRLFLYLPLHRPTPAALYTIVPPDIADHLIRTTTDIQTESSALSLVAASSQRGINCRRLFWIPPNSRFSSMARPGCW